MTENFSSLKTEKKVLKRTIESNSVHPGSTDTSEIAFFISLNKKDDISIGYFSSKNKIELSGFPYNYIITGDIDKPLVDGYTYANYFIKE